MNPLYLAFLGVLLAPLLMASWRVSLAGLSLQGILLAALLLQHDLQPSLAAGLSFLDAGLVRGILVPVLLWRAIRDRRPDSRNDVIPPNMISWTVAGILVAIAFRFAHRIVPGAPDETALAVASSGILLGLFVLSTQTGALSQAIGALRIENAIALFEIGIAPHESPLVIHLGLVLVFAASAVMFAYYVRRLESLATANESSPGGSL